MLRGDDSFEKFDRQFTRIGWCIGAIFVLVALVFIASFAWGFTLYNECRESGYDRLTCTAKINAASGQYSGTHMIFAQ